MEKDGREIALELFDSLSAEDQKAALEAAKKIKDGGLA